MTEEKAKPIKKFRAGTGLIGIIFWIGLIAVWLELLLLTPAYLIIKNTQE